MRCSKHWVVLCAVIFCGLLITSNTEATMSTMIPGAHSVETRYYDDLTTNNPEIRKGIGGSGPVNDWTVDGKPIKPVWLIPTAKVSGMEFSGMFGDSRFVIRIPDNWNRKLVVGASGGSNNERDSDDRLCDYVLTRFDDTGASYAYAYTDKGNRGEIIPAGDGQIYPKKKGATTFLHPDNGIESWNFRMKQLTLATKNLLLRLKGWNPVRTYISGTSNGGYVTRYAIENDPDIYDGGLDWEGPLWTPDVNSFTSKVKEIQNWKKLNDPKSSADEKKDARIQYGFPPESDFLMEYYVRMKRNSIDASRMRLDPSYKPRNWWEYDQYPEDYDNYNWKSRPKEVRQAITKYALTGNIKKPLISLHGTWDVQVHPFDNAVIYAKMIEKKGQGDLHRLYLIENANHLDSLVGNPKVDPNYSMQPILPYYHQAFDMLVDWVEKGVKPSPGRTIPMPSSKDKTINLITGEEIDKY